MKNLSIYSILFILLLLTTSFYVPRVEKVELVCVSSTNDTINYNFIKTNQLYAESWDTLSQPNFWRTLMNMHHDSALINVSTTRQIIQKVAIKDWNKQSDMDKDCFRDSVRCYYELPPEVKIFVTTGRKFFYDFDNVMPVISKGIEIFNENNVDPFYAQAILLIESPNKLQKSNVGAYGSFQIMKKVAINMGLKVNKYEDERKDFDKSAWAAAKLIRTICIPELNKILDDKCIEYNPTDIWYRLMVMHVYHAGAGNVKKAMDVINPEQGNMELITKMWQTEAGGFRNASQNYSQLVLASMLELDDIIYNRRSSLFTLNVE
ncbi:MAG: transglycosylase SLT domain-containing protein [Bacteroidetes bacterium]|nr:transglycosylase SLT domain-containing protein [Bacteroidota bacterium]